MKFRFAIIVLFLALACPGAVNCIAGDDYVTKYLHEVSVTSPITPHSAAELMEEGKPVAPAAGGWDPYSYIPHGKLEIPQGIRLMVFVPHPDDEALAASGIIQRVTAMEGDVKVVYVTSGDGYKEAVRLKLKNARITARDFIEFGKRRREEAVEAVCELGLSQEDAIFLDFPDDGIDELWESYWSKLKPFISPHTLFDRPHRKGAGRWIKYSGVELTQEMVRVISEFSPDWVILPDPRDFHPDHAAAGVFVLSALQSIYQDPDNDYQPQKVLTYLVHFRDFPYGEQWAGEVGASGIGRSSASARTLSGSQWVSMGLSAEEVEGKRRALLAHASQLQMLQGFFRNFLLPSEIFGSLNLVQVLSVPQEYAARFSHPLLTEPDESTLHTVE